MNKRPRLGRGLDALLGGDRAAATATSDAAHNKESLRQLPVECLQRGKYQPRTHMDQDALAELAASIKAQGIVQPIVARALGGEAYEIIAGERRWRAAQLAGLATVPVVVREIPDEAAIAITLIENIQRENLNPVEEAQALARLSEEFGLTHQEVADSVGRSRAAVSNLLRLLTLNADVRAALEQGQLDMGHARALLALTGGAQSDAARQVIARKLSVRETEALVRRLAGERVAPGPAKTVDADIRQLQDRLSEQLGARVAIQHAASGKGRLVIEYGSSDELEGILARIR